MRVSLCVWCICAVCIVSMSRQAVARSSNLQDTRCSDSVSFTVSAEESAHRSVLEPCEVHRKEELCHFTSVSVCLCATTTSQSARARRHVFCARVSSLYPTHRNPVTARHLQSRNCLRTPVKQWQKIPIFEMGFFGDKSDSPSSILSQLRLRWGFWFIEREKTLSGSKCQGANVVTSFPF